MKKLEILGVLIVFLLMASVSAYTMTRSVPTTAPASGTFQITYQVSGTGTWGASILDNAVGGCLFPGSVNQLKTVMLSTDGNTKTITVTSPASGSCTFSGDVKFGTDPIVNFPSATVTIGGTCTPSCTCASTTCIGSTCSNGCGGTCPGTKTGCTCTPDNSCASTTCTGATCINNCGTSIAGTKTCEAGTCSKFFSDTINLIGIVDDNCTNGYINTVIFALGLMFLINVFIKK